MTHAGVTRRVAEAWHVGPPPWRYENEGESLVLLCVYQADGQLYWQALVAPGRGCIPPTEATMLGGTIVAEVVPPLRTMTVELAVAGSAIVNVTVVAEDADLDKNEEERAAEFAKLAVMRLRRERRIRQCPGHEWDVFIDPGDRNSDMLCRCEALRSDVASPAPPTTTQEAAHGNHD